MIGSRPLGNELVGRSPAVAPANEIEALLGVRPMPGGRHPDYGSHNALLSLGEGTYLEVIAPDPEQEVPERGVVFGMQHLEASRLRTWVSPTQDIERLVARARSRGLHLGEVSSGGRVKPDGTFLSWKISDPYADRFGGAVPFLIDWGETPHPSTVAPSAGRLLDLRIEHPQPDDVRAALSNLGLDLEVEQAPAYRLVARIQTARGEIELS